jgi:putative oxidoreductase
MMNPDLGLLILRLCSGGVMLWAHGLPKMMNYAQYVQQFPSLLGMSPALGLSLAIFAEVICAGLLVAGLFSRLALIPLIITMGVAHFIVHAADEFAKKEMSLLYLAMYVALFLTGSGKYSAQQMFKISAGRFSWLLK